MNTLGIRKFTLLLITLSLLISCNKDDNDNGSSNAGDEYISAKIDGTSWKSSTDYDTTGGQLATQGSTTILALQGSDNDGNAISLQIFNYNGTGTYNTGDKLTNSNQIMFVSISPVATWASNLATAAVGTLTPGTITITSDDGKTIEGTFSFDGYNASDKSTKVISIGKFKVDLD